MTCLDIAAGAERHLQKLEKVKATERFKMMLTMIKSK